MNGAPKPIHITVPITKVDEEQRMVWGFATLEEVDAHGEIISYEASKQAFPKWIGNIREMHGDKAVGKGVEIQYDDTNKGVWLGSKISESADGENAWIKVKEGVLAGYSIGGVAKDFDMVKVGDEDHMMITEYDLSEVSLVDNPACPGATLQMVKSVDGGKGLQRTETLTKGDSRPVAWWERMYKYSPSQSIRKTVTVYNNSMNESDIKKGIYDAAYLTSLGRDLAYLIFDERYEGKDTKDLEAALKSIKAAASKQLAEDESFPEPVAQAIELAQKAVNLSKGDGMKKTTTGSEDRDANAEVVLSETETGRPVNDTQERAAEAGVPAAGEVVDNKDGDPVVQPLVHDQSEDAEKPAADAVTSNEEEVETAPETPAEAGKEAKGSKKVDVKVENKAPVSFEKSLSAITDSLTTLTEGVGKVVKSVGSLEGRIAELEGKPAPSKVAKGEFVDVKKAEEDQVSDEETKLHDLLKKADEYAADPSKGDIAERSQLAVQIRKAQRALDPASVAKANEVRSSFRK